MGEFVSTLYLAAGVAAVAGLPLLFWLRRRALRDPHVASWRASPQPELDGRESAALRAWHRRSIAAFTATVALLIAIAVTFALEWLPDPAIQIGLIGLLGCVAVGVALQFARRCPRCGMNIGLQSRLGLPRQCSRCRVVLRDA